MTDAPQGAFELSTQRLGALPIVDHFLARIGLRGLLERHLPAGDELVMLPAAVTIGVLVRNLCVARMADWKPSVDVREGAQSTSGIPTFFPPKNRRTGCLGWWRKPKSPANRGFDTTRHNRRLPSHGANPGSNPGSGTQKTLQMAGSSRFVRAESTVAQTAPLCAERRRSQINRSAAELAYYALRQSRRGP
jgi:hypothetical protein